MQISCWIILLLELYSLSLCLRKLCSEWLFLVNWGSLNFWLTGTACTLTLLFEIIWPCLIGTSGFVTVYILSCEDVFTGLFWKAYSMIQQLLDHSLAATTWSNYFLCFYQFLILEEFFPTFLYNVTSVDWGLYMHSSPKVMQQHFSGVDAWTLTGPLG